MNASVDNRPHLIPAALAASLLGVQPQTLRKWRWHGGGPRYVRIGGGLRGKVAYRSADLDEWLASRSFTNTAEETAAR